MTQFYRPFNLFGGYAVSTCLLPSMNNPIAYILGFYCCLWFDISWLFKGFEDFKKKSQLVTWSNFQIVVSIFLFVKKPSDLYPCSPLVAYDLLGQLVCGFLLREHIHKYQLDIFMPKSISNQSFSCSATDCHFTLLPSRWIFMLGALSSTRMWDLQSSLEIIEYFVVGVSAVVLCYRVSNLLSSNQRLTSYIFLSIILSLVIAGVFDC